ncbi:M81 family metallopeptidase [Paenibacillus qinlingensis]|uniref:Microcystin degradation protein MlrC n=1 Tax=Paenibacillus qinlingensis TaxID=1837343 RepID=A0ABU1NSN8_9BACL|nr:M81 family metallopeptidase [Paenibacillus qinlingensis]MDR6550495.1 microcystin degradation protein MlrC [Paenibacillus qinlingensis]
MRNDQLQIAVAGILHETNTFAPGITDIAHFREQWTMGGDAFVARYAGTRTTMGGVIAAAAVQGVSLLPGLYVAATPSGMVEAVTGDTLIDALVDTIDSRSDGLLLIMHGAMVSEQYADYEGECLRRLRAKLGPDFPIAMTIDLHGNISQAMVRHADLIVGYDTYPHVDMYERAVEAFDLLVRSIRGEIRPVRAMVHTGMLVVPQGMLTSVGSMKLIMDHAFEMERMPGVLNVTVAGGFPYSDVPDAGMSVVVTTDGDSGLAERCAAELAQMAIDRKETFNVSYATPREAVTEALAQLEGPVILAEGSDNVGGGAPADATHLLAELINVPKKAFIVIRDPEAVKVAYWHGIGGLFEGLVGGKSDSLHGTPVAVKGKIRLLFDGHYRHAGPYMTGQHAEMGLTAVVECGLLTLVLTEKRVAPWDVGHVRSVGLWPGDYHMIVAKSALAWQTAFGSFAKHVINVDSPGCCNANLAHFQYQHVSRPIYPMDSLPQPRFGTYD